MQTFKTYCIGLTFLLSSSLFGAEHDKSNDVFKTLMDRLINEGHSQVQVQKYFEDNRIQFIEKLVPLNLIPNNNKADYEGFLTEVQVNEGATFLRTNKQALENLTRGTGIPPEVVVSILKIESNFGRYSGKHSVFSTFATLSILNQPNLWNAIADTTTVMTREQLRRRAEKRSKWAYKELVSLIDICEKNGWDPLEVKGSWAGAFGWAQFLPTSFAAYARDGNGDGQIDPQEFLDAAASVVNFLKNAHWGSSLKSQRKAVHRYNPSQAYVDCILAYASSIVK